MNYNTVHLHFLHDSTTPAVVYRELSYTVFTNHPVKIVLTRSRPIELVVKNGQCFQKQSEGGQLPGQAKCTK